MHAFTTVVTRGAEFYLSAPTFFNWAGPLLFVGISGVIWFAYWLGGKFADSEINGLKAQALVLDQRFSFAREQADLSTREATGLKAQLDSLKGQIEGHAPVPELQNSTSLIEVNLIRLIDANTAVSKSLGHVSTGFDSQGRLTWRPIRSDEAEELLKCKKSARAAP